jgi:antitoxin component of MazEF toxin-antitoxin module
MTTQIPEDVINKLAAEDSENVTLRVAFDGSLWVITNCATDESIGLFDTADELINAVRTHRGPLA